MTRRIPRCPPVSSRWPLRHAVRVRSSSRLPTGGIVGHCSLPAGHFGHGPRPKLFPLAEHAIRNLLLRNQEPLELDDGVAPLPATSGLLFTLAGAFLPLRRNPPSLSGSVSSKGPRVFSVRLGLVRFRLRRFVFVELERKRSTFSRHPFRYLRMRHPSPRG